MRIPDLNEAVLAKNRVHDLIIIDAAEMFRELFEIEENEKKYDDNIKLYLESPKKLIDEWVSVHLSDLERELIFEKFPNRIREAKLAGRVYEVKKTGRDEESKRWRTYRFTLGVSFYVVENRTSEGIEYVTVGTFAFYYQGLLISLTQQEFTAEEFQDFWEDRSIGRSFLDTFAEIFKELPVTLIFQYGGFAHVKIMNMIERLMKG